VTPTRGGGTLLVGAARRGRRPAPGDKMLLVGDRASAPALADAVAAATAARYVEAYRRLTGVDPVL